jgi:hypothetical protein
VEQDIWQAYQTSHPGQVQVLGADLWNGTIAQVQTFKNQTGATFPLLLQGAGATGGDLTTLYGTYDNYVVIDQQGIVRYHAADLHAHGDRYYLSELRAVIDGLVMDPTGVPDGGLPPAALRLVASPNPFRGRLALDITNPSAETLPIRLSVFDVGGHVVATLAEGTALSPGLSRFTWDGGARRGPALAAGRYWIVASVGASHVGTSVVFQP